MINKIALDRFQNTAITWDFWKETVPMFDELRDIVALLDKLNKW